MAYCASCGHILETNNRFCTGCGAPIEAGAQPTAPPAPKPQAEPSWQAAPPVPLQTATPKRGSCLPALLIALGVVALIAMVSVAGIVYVGYKIKQKVASAVEGVEHSSPSAGEKRPESPGGAGGLLGSLTSLLGKNESDGDVVQTVSDRDPVEPCKAQTLASQNAAQVPLQVGTVITTAWGIKNGDVESRISVGSVDQSSLTEVTSTEAYKNDFDKPQTAKTETDTICNADLATANKYITVTFHGMPHLIHGVTRLRLSNKSFEEAKNSGKTELHDIDILQVSNGVKMIEEGGVLNRVEPQDIAYPMIVNDQKVTLPVIHLAGIVDSIGKDPRQKKDRPIHVAADAYVVDDPLDPLVLMWRLKAPEYHNGNFRIEVVKIEFKTAQPTNIIEKQLIEQKRAVTYGIYFDFNKDTIKSESEPVLKEIVQAMTDNPTWKLTVEGHTDNIGGDSYNLDLSKRRAAAVKQELVLRYHIAPDRLATDGFGASRPADTNETLEGRARNRRVELTRE